MVARLYLATGRLLRSVRRTEPSGLAKGALSALATLVASGPLRPGDLATCEQVAAPVMTRLVAALSKSGYVTAEPDPTDHRARLVNATPEGRRIVTGARTASITELRHRYDRLTTTQRQRLHAAIPVLETLVAPSPSTGQH